MNTTPRSQTPTNTRGHPPEFQQIITEKSENFVGREFVFAAINEFLHKYAHGYFTLIGAPGSGKSAILAKYVTENPHVIYYSAQVEDKNRADKFLLDICTQLIEMGSGEWGMGNRDLVLPDNVTEGSWFLSLLLQKISDSLQPNQPLIIAIDALDAIAPNSQAASSNLFYLPRYLPHKVYFLLTRRPFVRERSRLLIEAPSQILDLGDYPEQNRDDVQAYIQQCLTPLTSSLKLRLAKGGTRIEQSLAHEGTRIEESLAKGETRIEQSLAQEGTGEESSDRLTPPLTRGAGGVDNSGLSTNNLSAQEGIGMKESDTSNSPPLKRGAGGDLKSWLTTHNISEQEFCDRLTAQTENNFMYLSQILAAITEGFYSQALKLDRLPPNLEAYYQSHWQRMASKELSSVELGVLRCLVTLQPSLDPLLKKEGISAQLIAQMIDQDEYDVEAILENWIEFLQQEQIDREIRYSLYHSSFRDWLGQQLSHH